MSRLYDQIVEYGLHEGPTPLVDLMLQSDTVVVDVNNVAQYIANTYHARDYDKSWTPADFPNIAPPWELAFFEWRTEFKEYRDSVERVGLFMTGIEYGEDIVPLGFEDQVDKLKSEPRWMVSGSVIMKLRGMVPHYMGSFGLLADLSGSVCVYRDSDNGDAPMFGSLDGPYDTAARRAGVEAGLEQMAAPALLGISFMHCKNVSTMLNNPPEKVQKRRVRKGKKPLKAYYTLGIEPMANTLDRQGAAKKTGIKQALHICRGHFATYSPDKPLFGKYAGTFWKPQHVRGNKKHGEIVKDYAVKAPGGAS